MLYLHSPQNIFHAMVLN